MKPPKAEPRIIPRRGLEEEEEDGSQVLPLFEMLPLQNSQAELAGLK